MSGDMSHSVTIAPEIILRPYQAAARKEIVRKYTGKCYNLHLVAPTGAGKTKIITSVLHTLSNELKGALVVTPMEAIETGFDEDITIKVQNHLGTTEVGSGNIYLPLRKEHDKGASATDILQGLSEFRAGLTTHAQLHSWGTDILLDDMTDRLLVVDEGHHVTQENGTKLGDFAREWSERGGAVLYVTATPFRYDGKSVLPEDSQGFMWTIAEHAQGGLYAPEHFVASTVATDMEVTTLKEYDGDALPSGEEMRDGYRVMVEQWLEDGCPKAVFMVPTFNSKTWARALYRALLEEGLEPSQVVNAVGKDKRTKQRFNAAIASEKTARTYEESKVQIFIACRRFDEGTDWQFCSHVYCWGVPYSLSSVIQKWGRAMRFKGHIPDYPDEFRNTAKITFFVHKIKEGSEASFSAKHEEYAWLLGTLLADWETGVAYRHSLRIRFDRAYKKAKKSDDDGDDQTEIWQSIVLPENVRLEARKLVEQCVVWQGGEDAPPSTAESVLSDLDSLHMGGAISEEVMAGVLQIICERMCGEDEDEPTPEETKVRATLEKHLVKLVKKITKKMKKTKTSQKEWVEESSYIRKELAKTFRRVIDEYKDHTLCVDDEVFANVTNFTGNDAQEVARKLREGMSTWNISVESVSEALQKFFEEHGRCASTCQDGKEDASMYFDRPPSTTGNWNSINQAMYQGNRGYDNPELNTIAKLNTHLGLREGSAPSSPISKKSVSEALRAFYEFHGRCVSSGRDQGEDASCYFGRPPESMGTWHSITGAMRCGHRGYDCSELNSIPKLNAHLGLAHSPSISVESVSEALRAFYNEHGQCITFENFSEDASRYFGRPPESMGTWGAINKGMRKGYRGYGKSKLNSIPKLNAHLGLAHSLTSISVESVSGALLVFHKKHGRFVSERDFSEDASLYFGMAPGSTGTWRVVCNAMRCGRRGYSNSKLKSIAKLNAHLGLKKGASSSPISKKSVSGALRAFYEKHGQCATVRNFSEDASCYFGRPPESMGTWGTIDSAMRKGYRGYDSTELKSIAKLNKHLGLKWT
tara:strand:- start:2933 stop:6052 length:3120 start_codon:yes stop_codon:yes gene_type:complete